MLERARQVTAAERLDNIRYELGDAEVHRFDPAGFDVAISRFGTMFFSDPAAAFANIAAALQPEARLVLLVWQRRKDNEWVRAFDAALGDAVQPPPAEGDAFSLGDAEATAGMLASAGFDNRASRTYASRCSSATTSMPRSESSRGFRTRARHSRA